MNVCSSGFQTAFPRVTGVPGSCLGCGERFCILPPPPEAGTAPRFHLFYRLGFWVKFNFKNVTIARTWRQPKCPSTDEWIKKMWCMYTMEYYSAIKKTEIMPFAATWMDLEIIILSEVRQRKTNIIWCRLHVESKKMIQMNLFTKQIDSQTKKTNLWLSKRKGGGGIN